MFKTGRKLGAAALGLALAALGMQLASAGAHFNPDFAPHVPGVGDPRGVYGSGPQLVVVNREVTVFRKSLVPIALQCTTSTRAGCSGAVELTDQGGRQSSARFELYEGEVRNVFLTLPSGVTRMVRSRKGWMTQVKATGRDSVGRSDTDTTAVRIVRRDRHR